MNDASKQGFKGGEAWLRAGEHPGADALLGYVAGDLSKQDSESLKDHLALCPRCSRLVLALNEVQQDPSPTEGRLSAQELDQRWQEFQARLHSGHESQPEIGGDATQPDQDFSGPRLPTGLRPLRRQLFFARALAAAFALTAGLSIWIALQDDAVNVANPTVVTLSLSSSVTRGDSPGPTTAKAGESFFINMTPVGAGNFERFNLEILDRAGSPIDIGLTPDEPFLPGEYGMLWLELETGLPAGRYTVRGYGISGDGRSRTLIGEDEFEVK